MLAGRLKKGSHARVVAPSSSLHIISLEQRRISSERLAQLGLSVSYGKHAEECDEFLSSATPSRIADIHEAVSDPKVDIIFSAIGGHFSNQLLSHLDYDLIARNPKIFCGYSDIAALNAAIYAKTGLVTYNGPHFSTFSMVQGLEYTLEYFRKCFFETAPYEFEPSPVWSDDPWYLKQDERDFVPNEGWLVIREGEAAGTTIAGNLATLNLLQGTPFMPPLNDSILFVEEDFTCDALDFDRNLQSVLHLPEFSGVRALVIGRFQKKSQVSDNKLIKIILSKPELSSIPVIANASFGHTQPQCTIPTGGTATLKAKAGKVQIAITKH